MVNVRMCKCANCRLCITEHLQQKALARNEALQFKATICTFAHLHIIIDSYVSKKTTRISPPKDDQLDVHRVDGYVGAKRFE